MFKPRILLIFTIFLSASSYADSVESLAEELVRMRADVDRLNTELEEKQQRQKQDVSRLLARKAELEANIKSEDLNIRQIRQTLEENRKQIEKLGVSSEFLLPQVNAAIDKLSSMIETGIPFKTSERLQALGDIREQLQRGAIDANTAANRIWLFIEDELRMADENGLFQQTIELAGEQLLVDVAKVGTVFLFFRTPDDRVGYARASEGGWRFVATEAKQDKQNISMLFDAFSKQIRQGYFTLPNALPL